VSAGRRPLGDAHEWVGTWEPAREEVPGGAHEEPSDGEEKAAAALIGYRPGVAESLQGTLRWVTGEGLRLHLNTCPGG
jgi:hypothetical protein